MRFAFRNKLLGIAAVPAAAMVAILAGSRILSARVDRQLSHIQRQYLPLVELEPQLEAGLERIDRGFQDAVAAHDLDALDAMGEVRREFVGRLDAAREATDPATAAELRGALDVYFAKADQVSRRLFAGETGEDLVDAIQAMQAAHARTATLVKQTAALDPGALAAAFRAALDAESTASTYRMWLCIASLVVATSLTIAMSRGLVRNVAALARGFSRFGRGAFDEPIGVSSRDEFGQLARDANAMAASLHRLDTQRRHAEEALVAANQELEAFSYSVAHDLRAPLRGINGFCRALVEDYGDELDSEAGHYLQRIDAATQRMAELIDALLALARVTRAEFRRAPVNLSQVADGIVKQLRASEPSRSVEFVNAEGVVADGDAALLRALLENLLGNAWKFTGKKDPAQIAFGVEGSSVYYVRDNGAGFDMAYAEKLFAPFQRLHAQREFSGTGIGLATVQRIVRRHGGRIWAEGAVGGGATFRFTLSGQQEGVDR
ncbi:MAG TPA: ATP-binding protein [Polyangiaceae bacterium]